MKDHIETYHSTLDSLLKTYRGKTAPDKLERAAYASAQSQPDFMQPEEERSALLRQRHGNKAQNTRRTSCLILKTLKQAQEAPLKRLPIDRLQ